MKPNPGGQLSPEHIIGRDGLIAEMWGILEGRSIYMNDLRRIGKTQIMVKMHAQPPPGWVAVKSDLGGIHTAAEFATLAYRQSSESLGQRQLALRRMTDLLGKASGLEIAGLVKLPDGSPAPWKEVLRRTFADIEEAMAAKGSDWRMVFFWDEVPYLLDNITKREGPAVAMEVLDSLRALGQDFDRVRLLLTGSIGIHHILGELKAHGYNGSPLNRMDLVQPGPIQSADGISLALALLEGQTVADAREQTCAAAIAEAVGYVPFYIHKLISRLPRAAPATPSSIATLLDREITSDNNDWDLGHYRDRLRPYYGADEKLALHVLDAVAILGQLGFQAISRTVAVQMAVDDEKLRHLLKLLCMDHYLARTEENEYRFYLALIRRWWRLSRSL
jgi:uncharacterized protein